MSADRADEVVLANQTGTAVAHPVPASTAERFENPGLPPHVLRHADVDPRAAKRAERQVMALFTLSILGTIAFLLAFWLFPENDYVVVPLLGRLNAYHVVLGVTMALSLLGIGFGVVHWAKTLMSDHEVIEMRHEQRSTDEERAAAATILSEGAESAQLGRRPMLKFGLGGALSLFALPVLAPVVRGLGPLPHSDLKVTMWDKGVRLMTDPMAAPIRPDQVTVGSVFHVLPEGIHEVEHPMTEKARSAVILVRLHPDKIKSEKQKEWGYEGIVAYSKICTHVGCPVGLYEQQTHHLLCPCHQSTFDMTQDCKVIFGPAKRALPQLKITVNDEGYLVADAPFAEPVGPSFWEREL